MFFQDNYFHKLDQSTDLVDSGKHVWNVNFVPASFLQDAEFVDLNFFVSPFLSLDLIRLDPTPFQEQQTLLQKPPPSFQAPPSDALNTFIPYLNLSISLESPVPYLVGLVSQGSLPGFVPFNIVFESFSFGGFERFDQSDSFFDRDGDLLIADDFPTPNQSPQTGANIALNTQEDTLLPLALTAPVDPDGDTLVITISTLPTGGIVRLPGDSALMIGDTLTPAEVAQLEFLPNADFNGNAGQLELEVSDGTVTVDQTISITVVPVNDAPSDILLSSNKIGENAVAGDVVGTLSAIDIDSAGPFTYTLVGGATSEFEIVGNEVRVKAGTNLDYETLNQYSLSIEVQDSDGAAYVEVFQIDVQNNFEATVGNVLADHNVQTISFSETYTNPVVFAFLSTFNGGNQAIARVQNVTNSSFQVHVDEPSNLNPFHVTETINYFVAEAGKWQFSDGTLFEIGTYEMNHVTRASGFETVNFLQDYSIAPVVLSQVQTTENGEDFLKVRQRNGSKDNIEFSLEPEEDDNQVDLISDETIGYFAIESITGNWEGNLFESGITPDVINHTNYVVPYDQVYSGGTSIFLGSINKFDGPDSSQLRGKGSNGTSQTVFVEEDTTKDGETNHTTESASYIVFDEASTNLGNGISAVSNVISISDGVTLTNFGTITLNNFSTSQILNLDDMLDVNSDGQGNSTDLLLLESIGDLNVIDDGTDVTLDFSVGAQTGGILVLDGFSQSATQTVNTVDDLINQVQVVVTQ